MISWPETYTALLDSELESIAFQPITCDTPGVVADMHNLSFWYTGEVCLRFVGTAEVFLSWEQRGYQFELIAERAPIWPQYALDRISMSREKQWSILSGARLRRILLFTSPEMETRGIIAARHDFERAGVGAGFWVATGDAPTKRVDGGDDLFVGLENPPNLDELQLIEIVGAPQNS